MARLFAYITHSNGVVEDIAFELSAAAGKIDSDAPVTAIVFGSGEELDKVCKEIASVYPVVWKIENQAHHSNPELIREVLPRLLPESSVILIPHDHFGMELSPGLSIKLNGPYLPDVVDIEGVEGGMLKIIRDEYNGKVQTHVKCDITGNAVINIRSGVFHSDKSNNKNGLITDKTKEAIGNGEINLRRRFLEIIEAETGDVDITKSEMLVSVGRGIEEQDNLELVFELANAIGADVSCSRPIADSNWLEKSRQVGSSGKTVKPKVYLAFGISGAFQHMAGLKGSPFIIAVNKDAKAPIFKTASIGVVADMLEFVPTLTEVIKTGCK